METFFIIVIGLYSLSIVVGGIALGVVGLLALDAKPKELARKTFLSPPVRASENQTSIEGPSANFSSASMRIRRHRHHHHRVSRGSR
ncbi:MAG: hypothetical protein AB7G80_05975 [Dongiaceae bacterium]